MKPSARLHILVIIFAAASAIFFGGGRAQADPSKYPQFAQQKLPDNITPQFISIDELRADLKSGKKPMIIDVRTEQEYREVHILSAISAPLGEFTYFLDNIPRDRPLVLY